MSKPALTSDLLRSSAADFAMRESLHAEPSMYGVTDGKAVGTYLEHKFRTYLLDRFTFDEGNSAKGIDFPGLGVDLKTTSISKPQSSCPFRSARQKIFGLGYSVLLMAYEKVDDHEGRTGRLHIRHAVFISPDRTGDFQTTSGLRDILARGANKDDLIAFMAERRLPIDEIDADRIADELLISSPEQGYLTITQALQWRLYYSHALDSAGNVEGVIRLK